jgi:DNA-binding beta-propeller fold protein YncE
VIGALVVLGIIVINTPLEPSKIVEHPGPIQHAINDTSVSQYELVREWSLQVLEPKHGEFNIISSIALDQSGNVFVLDRENNRIQKFDSEGKFLTKWGSYGFRIDNYKFNRPLDLTLDRSGNVYVADTQNGKIRIFSNEGRFLYDFGRLVEPRAVDMDTNYNLFVLDGEIMKKFTKTGLLLGQWGGQGELDGEFVHPQDIVVDSSDNVYVLDSGHQRVQKFDSDGHFLYKWGSYGHDDGQFAFPSGIAIDREDNVYIVDPDNGNIQIFTAEGRFLQKLNIKAIHIAIDNEGDLYVSDIEGHTIQKFDKNGRLLKQWGKFGNTLDVMLPDSPSDLAIDNSGFVYVVEDSNGHRVLKFDKYGNLITKWGKQGSNDDEFFEPSGMAVDKDGSVLVADKGNQRVKRFTADGSLIGIWSKDDKPVVKIAVDKNDNIFATGDEGIRKFSGEGELLARWGNFCTLYGIPASEYHFIKTEPIPAGTGCVDPDDAGALEFGDGQFFIVSDIAIDSDGYVYVADAGNDRIQKFDSNGKFVSKIQLPKGMAHGYLVTNSHNNLYLASVISSTIQKFDPDDRLIAKWGSFCNPETEEGCVDPDGDGPLTLGQEQLYYIRGIDVDDEGNVYIVDSFNGLTNRVLVFGES